MDPLCRSIAANCVSCKSNPIHYLNSERREVAQLASSCCRQDIFILSDVVADNIADFLIRVMIHVWDEQNVMVAFHFILDPAVRVHV